MKKYNKYTIENVGNTESIINISLINKIKSLNIEGFIQGYKISNFFKGKFFLKRLIKKIFKYKLKNQINWNKSFWDKVDLSVINAEIQYYNPSYKNLKLEDFIKLFFNKKRLKDINAYVKLIKNNTQFDYPLFIDTQALNLLGANQEPNKLYLLDGARRIIAALVCKKQKQKIYLISVKK
tara:strand:+ start:200 stop:739 length:540 start_codon:yes stop_codon:yes gene_type:complete